eukprot:TCONS_00037524-protein
MADLEELVRQYFNRGYSYAEIISTLRELHQCTISIRKLHRILRGLNLYRRKHSSDTREVISFIEQELKQSSSLLGYRLMHQKCIQRGFRISRKNVALILKSFDPEGVQHRTRRVLKRRQYWSRGPNYVWHLDGYDKLKPYGFSIHGAIDGFSRCILWLEVVFSNKDPALVNNFYLETVQKISGVPRKVVGDRGTENIYIAASQRFLTRFDIDRGGGEQSFKYGRSVSNQRIEAWWSMLRRTCTNWWINFFKDLIERDIFDTSNIIHCECIKFCFYLLLQQDLDKTKELWNNHRIRPSINTDRQTRPAGRPNILYYTPSVSEPSITDYKFQLDQSDYNIVKDVCTKDINRGFICSNEFYELALIIMQEYSLQLPNSTTEGVQLYNALVEHINRI